MSGVRMLMSPADLSEDLEIRTASSTGSTLSEKISTTKDDSTEHEHGFSKRFSLTGKKAKSLSFDRESSSNLALGRSSSMQEGTERKAAHIFKTWDADNDGYWSFTEAQIAVAAMENDAELTEDDFSKLCKAWGADPNIGLTAKHIFSQYVVDNTNLERDYLVSLRRNDTFRNAPANSGATAILQKQLATVGSTVLHQAGQLHSESTTSTASNTKEHSFSTTTKSGFESPHKRSNTVSLIESERSTVGPSLINIISESHHSRSTSQRMEQLIRDEIINPSPTGTPCSTINQTSVAFNTISESPPKMHSSTFTSEALDMLPTFISPKHNSASSKEDAAFATAPVTATQNSWHSLSGSKPENPTSVSSEATTQWKSVPEGSNTVIVDKANQKDHKAEALASSLEALTNLYLKKALTADELAAAKAKLLGTEPPKRSKEAPDQLLVDNMINQLEYSSIKSLSVHTIPVCSAIRSVHQSWAATRFFTPHDFSNVKQTLLSHAPKSHTLVSVVNSFLEFYASGNIASLGFNNDQTQILKISALGGNGEVLKALQQLMKLSEKIMTRPGIDLNVSVRNMIVSGDYGVAGELVSLMEIVEEGGLSELDFSTAQDIIITERLTDGSKVADDLSAVHKLCKRGVITNVEFVATKNRLLHITAPTDSWFTAPTPHSSEMSKKNEAESVPTPFLSNATGPQDPGQSIVLKQKRRVPKKHSHMGVPRSVQQPIVPPVSTTYPISDILEKTGSSRSHDSRLDVTTDSLQVLSEKFLNGNITAMEFAIGKKALAVESEKDSSGTWETAADTDMYSAPSTEVMFTPEEIDLDPQQTAGGNKIIKPSDITTLASSWQVLGRVINNAFTTDDVVSSCSTSLPTTPCLPEPLTFRDRLMTFFHCYRPSKLPSVEPTVRNGDERQVMSLLVLKYGPEPTTNIMALPLAVGWVQCESTAGDIFYTHEGGERRWARPILGF